MSKYMRNCDLIFCECEDCVIKRDECFPPEENKKIVKPSKFLCCPHGNNSLFCNQCSRIKFLSILKSVNPKLPKDIVKLITKEYF